MHNATPGGRYSICSEARGPHWIAWVAREPGGKPVDAVVLVGETKEEAESRASQHAADLTARGEL